MYSHTLLVEMQNGTATLEDSLVFPTRLNILLTCDPSVGVLSIYLKELKTYIHAKTCTWMFIAVLFIVAKTWKQ